MTGWNPSPVSPLPLLQCANDAAQGCRERNGHEGARLLHECAGSGRSGGGGEGGDSSQKSSQVVVKSAFSGRLFPSAGRPECPQPHPAALQSAGKHAEDVHALVPLPVEAVRDP